ncbi:hypothetical protein QT381_02955 [Galbitalea sp. SE-J8]|uniref:DsbA family protein n=1 Tax=Galbitalea sp. SE-J8 TaxID=3054952 RepID=UPI00259CF2A2|nr:hypothetical protein [Galbitalea sp. SE-J8]MDM4761963.1 hypothetical protein [Galbitalea sp. SE-J8]
MAKTTLRYDTSGMTKKERLAFAREIAAMEREAARERRRRNRALLIGGVSFGVVVVLALAAWTLWSRYQETLAGPADMLSDGIVLTSDGSTVSARTTARIEPGASSVATDPSTLSQYPYVVLYLDAGDPKSRTLWSTDAAQLTSWLTSGYIALEVHPIARAGAFSERAADALGCVADGAPDTFLAVLDALMTAGGDDDASARTADGVLGAVSNAGVTDDAVLDCVRGDRFGPWVAASTARAEAAIPNADVARLSGTPLLLVDQKSYTGALDDANGLMTFISKLYAAASGATDDGTGDATSTPTDTPTDGATETPTPTPTPEATDAG